MPFQRARSSGGQSVVPIRADLYPARVVDGGGGVLFDPVKALVGLDTLWLYSVNGSSGSLVAEFGIDDIAGSVQGGFEVVSGGVVLRVVRSGDCGCGHNRSWRPFPYRLVMVPIRGL